MFILSQTFIRDSSYAIILLFGIRKELQSMKIHSVKDRHPKKDSKDFC